MTSTVHDPYKTKCITIVDGPSTIRKTVGTAVHTVYSTTTKLFTKTATHTLAPKACLTKYARGALEARAYKTKTKVITTTLAGKTTTEHIALAKKTTKTIYITAYSTKTVVETESYTTTKTATKTPACTAKGKRDLGMMFG